MFKNSGMPKIGRNGKIGVRAGRLATFAPLAAFAPLAMLVLTLAATGCQNGMMPTGKGRILREPATGKAPAKIVVSGGEFGSAAGTADSGGRAARTVMPVLDPRDFDEFIVRFTGAGQNAGTEYAERMTGNVNGLSVELAVSLEMGEWEIFVIALVGGHEVASGGANIVAIADETVKAAINLKPIFTDGSGVFTWTIDSEKRILGGTLKIERKLGAGAGLVETVNLPGGSFCVDGTKQLDVGLYVAHIHLETEDGFSSAVSHVVWVYRGATSAMYHDAKLVRHALIRILQESWTGRIWDFIEPDKIMRLFTIFEDSGDIRGIRAGDYANVQDLSATLTPISAAAGTPLAGYGVDRFEKLLDSALILRAQEDGRIPAFDKIYRDRAVLENLVTGIVNDYGNGSDVWFDWDSWSHFNGRLPVIVGGVYGIELDVNWAYIAAKHTSKLLQTGRSGILQIKLDCEHIEDEDGAFTFTANAPVTQAKTINVTGLPSGVTIADGTHFTNTVTRSGGTPWGNGMLYLEVDENVAPGRYPISIRLGTDELVGVDSLVCVQDLTISPDYVSYALYATVNLNYVVTGEGFPYPGTYSIKVPGNGQKPGQLNWGLKTTTTQFVVGEDGKGRGTINMAGIVEFDDYAHNGKNPITITVDDLEVPIIMDRIGKLRGRVWANIIGSEVRGKAGENITIPVVAENYLMYPNEYYAQYHPGSEYTDYHWMIEPVPSNTRNNWDPGVKIPANSGIVINQKLSTWRIKPGREDGGNLVLTLGEKKGRYPVSVYFGMTLYTNDDARTSDSFFVVVE